MEPRHLASEKNLRFFSSKEKFNSPNENIRFSHEVQIITKTPREGEALREKHIRLWFEKKGIEHIDDAYIEVVAQEFFRLCIPTHPKCRIAFNITDNGEKEISVISQGVAGYCSLETMDKEAIKAGIKEGTIKGLGYVTLVNLVLGETDFKLDNGGLDEDGNIIKIDGGCCFTSLFEDNLDITTQDIEILPYIENYPASNWLDLFFYIAKPEKNSAVDNENLLKSTLADNPTVSLVKEDDDGFTFYNDNPETIDKEISGLPHFEKEVNEAILRIICLPDELIKSFVKAYIPYEEFSELAGSVSDEIIQRKNNLKKAALASTKFKTYLASDAAKIDLEAHIGYLVNFKTAGKEKLSCTNLRENVLRQFEQLTPFSREKIDQAKKVMSSLGSLFSFKTQKNTTLPPSYDKPRLF